MRLPRWKTPETGRGVYHCISRVVDQRFVLGDEEKTVFRNWMQEYENFCGVRVLTYCLLSNHFHLLIEVPPRAATPLPAAEVLRRLDHLTGTAITAATAREQVDRLTASGGPSAAEAYLDQFRRRMGDLSIFLKLLKQRFTQWYNRRNQRQGTLWEGRFKSVLVEGHGKAVLAIAAYIDLNPVRAGLVADPGAFRWSGYGEVVAENAAAIEKLRALYGLATRLEDVPLALALRGYRDALVGRRHQPEAQNTSRHQPPNAPQNRPPMPVKNQAALEALRSKKELPLDQFLRCRNRYFSDGAAVGSQEYLEALFHQRRDRFGPRRLDGARRIRGLTPALYSFRDLRLRVFG